MSDLVPQLEQADGQHHRPTTRELLTVMEAAQLLRVSRTTMYELIWQDQVPYLKLGRLIRVPRAALLAWIEQATGPGSERPAA